MALLYLDGFEHYGDTNIDDIWSIVPEEYAPYIRVEPGGRHTANALILDHRPVTGTNGGQWGIKLSKGDYGQSGGVFGCAMRWENLGKVNNHYWEHFFSVWSGGWKCFYVSIFDDGTLIVYEKVFAGSPTLDRRIWGPSTFSMEENVWHYFEMKWIIGDDDAGYLQMRVDGMTIMEMNTETSGDASGQGRWTTIEIAGNSTSHLGGQGYALWIDDLYLLNLTGTTNNDFLGDITVKTVFVQDDGAYSQWDGSDGDAIDNYQLVDEADPDDDTTYVETRDIGDADTYIFADIDTTDVVLGVQLSVNVRKTDEGDAAITSRIRHSSTDYDAYSNAYQEPFGLGGVTEYYYVDFPWDTHPNGSAWTPTLVNDSEFGFLKSR